MIMKNVSITLPLSSFLDRIMRNIKMKFMSQKSVWYKVKYGPRLVFKMLNTKYWESV